ncbi:MAG: isocitrate lyase/PEP mutase family protein [Terriglobales bacterium]
MNRKELAQRLRALHQGERPVLFANCWDVASARTLAEAGFPAVATSSAAIANTRGYADGQRIPRAEMLEVVGRIARGVKIPVSADCEGGYSDDPHEVGETARLLLQAGAVGMNLEDSEEDESRLVALDLQVAKIKAVRAAAAHAGVPLVLNARVDAMFLHGPAPADPWGEAVSRAQVYRAAGADCIFVPGMQELGMIRRFVEASPGPLNILGNENSASVEELARAGVRRISLGSRPYLAALALLRRIGEDLRGPGSFGRVEGAMTYAEVNGWFRES